MKHDPFDVELDEEEQEISDAISDALDRGELKMADDFEELLKQAKEAASNYSNDKKFKNTKLSQQ